MELNNFTQRTLSGAAYVAVVVASILVHPIAYGIIFLLVSILAVREFHQLMQSSLQSTILSMIAAAILFIVAWIPSGLEDMCYGGFIIIGSCLYAIVFIAALMAELWLKSENPIQNWGNFLQSQMMIALPFAMMCLLAFLNKYLLLAVFVLIWVNDTGAYCMGSLTAKLPKGNHKMFPRVSPKKSWEGLIGGFVFAMGSGALLAHFGWLDITGQLAHPCLTGILFAFVIAVAATFGDLLESLFKRSIGVKDSGSFLPGHGGVLDRFDSMLLAVPVAVLFIIVMY